MVRSLPLTWLTHRPLLCLTYPVRSVAWQHPDGAQWRSLRSRSASDGFWTQLAAQRSPPDRLAPKSPWQRCRRSQQMLSPSPSPWQLHPEHHDGAGWPVGVAFRVVKGVWGGWLDWSESNVAIWRRSLSLDERILFMLPLLPVERG